MTENQRNGFPSEWELEGKSKDEQRLDNRAAWALQEERHNMITARSFMLRISL